jgi:hypothetical protein
MTGRQLFMGLQSRIYATGGVLNSTPPLTYSATQLETITGVITAPATFMITMTPATLLPGEKIWLASNGFRSVGVSRIPVDPRKIALLTAQAGPHNLIADWEREYGNLISGTAIWLQARVVNTLTGVVSAYVPARIVVS